MSEATLAPTTCKISKVLKGEGDFVETDVAVLTVEVQGKEVSVFPSVAGEIVEVMVREGQTVEEDAELFMVDDEGGW
jgi:biotin carboxyl carrier protein